MAKERGEKKERRKERRKEINKERSARERSSGGRVGRREEDERARRERGAQARRNEIVKREENGCREVFL